MFLRKPAISRNKQTLSGRNLWNSNATVITRTAGNFKIQNAPSHGHSDCYQYRMHRTEFKFTYNTHDSALPTRSFHFPFWSRSARTELIQTLHSIPSSHCNCVIAYQSFHIRTLDLCGQGFERGTTIHLFPAGGRPISGASSAGGALSPRGVPFPADRNRMNITNVKLTAMQFHARYMGRMLFLRRFQVLSMCQSVSSHPSHTNRNSPTLKWYRAALVLTRPDLHRNCFTGSP